MKKGQFGNQRYWQPVDPVVGDPVLQDNDKVRTRGFLAPPSVHFDQERLCVPSRPKFLQKNTLQMNCLQAQSLPLLLIVGDLDHSVYFWWSPIVTKGYPDFPVAELDDVAALSILVTFLLLSSSVPCDWFPHVLVHGSTISKKTTTVTHS